MFKRFLGITAVLAMALVSVPAMATDNNADSANVTLTIEQYCDITITSSPGIVLSEGASAGSTEISWQVFTNWGGSNVALSVNPGTAPGTWTVDPALQLDTGFTTGSHTLSVSGIGPFEAPATHTVVATMTCLGSAP